MNDLIACAESLESPLVEHRSPVSRLLEAFLSGRSPETIKAYRQDLHDFRAFLNLPTAEAAAERLLAAGPGDANALALAYKAALFGRALAPATINRRLAALRSVVRLARVLGLVPWSLEVRNERSETYRDTRGPGSAGFRRVLAQSDSRTDAKGLRDRAILHLLYDLALRRIEVTRLDLEDLRLEDGTLAVLGKGKRTKSLLTLPDPTRRALEAWLAARGTDAGPLFTTLHRGLALCRQRLTGRGLYDLVRTLGRQAGVKARPHGLRHAAITEALELTRGDVRAVQRFSRHAKPETLLRYDDNRTDLAGQVARRVAG